MNIFLFIQMIEKEIKYIDERNSIGWIINHRQIFKIKIRRISFDFKKKKKLISKAIHF